MTNARLSILFIICLSICTSIYSQNYVFEFQKINVEDGLPHRSAKSIVQDLDGFIWVSTSSVISKYDGYQFKYYDSKFLKISEKNPVELAVDKFNRIWYCENDNSLKIYHSGVIDSQKDSIISIASIAKGLFSADDILSVNQSTFNKTDIFITTRRGVIYKYNGEFEEIYKLPKTLKFFAVCDETSKGNYVILNAQNILTIKNKKLVGSYQILKKNDILYRILNTSPYVIVESRDWLYNTSYWKIENGHLEPYKLKITSSERFQIFKITKNFTYCSINKKILILNNSGDVLFTYSDLEYLGKPIQYRSAFTDKQEILWIGTTNGIIKISTKKNPFTLYQKNQSIRGIYKNNNTLIVGSYTENASIDLSTGQIKTITENNAIASSSLKDNDTYVWFGSIGNVIYKFTPLSNKWEEHPINENIELFVTFKNPYTQKLWIGASDGLVCMNPETNTIAYHQSPLIERQTEIRSILKDGKNIWICSNKGLFLMDAYTEAIIEHYSVETGLPFENINHLYIDDDGIFWLATKGGGLIHWNRKDKKFTTYTTQNGFSNNTIYAVYPDNYNNLWLPSNNGLIRFNKKTENVRVYLPSDGIAHEEFNTFAHFKDLDGTLYFGGLNGVTAFHPKELLNENNIQTYLKLTGIQVLNENRPKFESVIEPFKKQRKIILKPSDRVLEIEVSLLDFENPSEIQYLYQIEGYQNQWLYTNNNKITFNNLPYGTYNINIKGKRLTSNANSNVLQIPVVVKKPFYLTWQFILLLFGLLIFVFFIYSKWRFKKLVANRDFLEEEVKQRTQQIEKDKQIITDQAIALKELDEVKSRFFTNITHEFRTPLTLIKGPLEQIMDNPPPPNIFKRRINGVLKNTNHMLNLINQLLDLSKLESAEMPLEIVHHDIVEYTKEIIAQFQSLIKKKEQRLTFITSEKEWFTHFDADKWNKILYNLLSNAIKFTPKNGKIEVLLKNVQVEHADTIFLQVKDSGDGMDEEQQKFIFDRFYQVDNTLTRQHDGTGIGLALVKETVNRLDGSIHVESKKNQGTTFIIQLPIIKHEHMSTELPSLKSINLHFTEDIAEDPPVIVQDDIEETEKLELLIVEDNKDMREYIMQCLNHSLYNITQASNGEEGLKKAQTQIPDLIISDVMMPKMDGFEFTKTIRETVSTSHIPLILLTAKAAMESKLEGLTRGADAYLTKPFSPKELELRVQNLIEIRNIIQKRYANDAPLIPSKAYRQEDIFITKLKEYIITNLDATELNGDQIGDYMTISRVHLYRKLKALTNLSITEYIKKVRLEMAFKMLQEGQFNVSEIAYKTGFSSPNIFSKAFKKAYGKSPSQM